MHSPLVLSFVGLERSGALEVPLREIGQRLLRHSGRITRCHVTAEGSPGQGGCPQRIRVHLSLPGAEIHAGETCRDGGSGVALQETLNAVYLDALRQLQALERQRHSRLLPGAPPSP